MVGRFRRDDRSAGQLCGLGAHGFVLPLDGCAQGDERISADIKAGRIFTAIWNPRDIQRSALHTEIEDMIYQEVPGLKRVSSGSAMTTEKITERKGVYNAHIDGMCP